MGGSREQSYCGAQSLLSTKEERHGHQPRRSQDHFGFGEDVARRKIAVRLWIGRPYTRPLTWGWEYRSAEHRSDQISRTTDSRVPLRHTQWRPADTNQNQPSAAIVKPAEQFAIAEPVHPTNPSTPATLQRRPPSKPSTPIKEGVHKRHSKAWSRQRER